MSIIQTFSDFSGLPPLVVETLFLLLLAIIITVVFFLIQAIFRIRYEMIKMNYTINYIVRLLERGYKKGKLYKVNIDRESEAVVLEMLQEGKSYDEILREVRVSKEFVEVIEEVATKKGLLPKKNQ
jgi:hypothetical protein